MLITNLQCPDIYNYSSFSVFILLVVKADRQQSMMGNRIGKQSRLVIRTPILLGPQGVAMPNQKCLLHHPVVTDCINILIIKQYLSVDNIFHILNVH